MTTSIRESKCEATFPPLTLDTGYIIVKNFEAGESDSIDVEFLQLGPNLVIEDLKYCQSYTNGTSADITEADCYVVSDEGNSALSQWGLMPASSTGIMRRTSHPWLRAREPSIP